MDLKEKVDTIVSALLYVLNNVGGQADFHKVFKILYFADQKHLAKYGSLITDDRYIAMYKGPVPSIAYDILKALRGDGLLITQKGTFDPYFELLSKHTVRAKTNADLDELSKSEIECIDNSIEENKNLSFTELTEKSHDLAWNRTHKDYKIKVNDIATAGGANDAMIEYINTTFENQSVCF